MDSGAEILLRPYTVTQVNRYIKSMIEGDPALESIQVEGEISSFKAHTSGHLYFTLKDEESRLKAVMFKGNAAYLRFVPEDGILVTAYGRIGVYEKNGEYQLYVERMEPSGLGSLYLAFEQLKKRLLEEGLFDESLKRPIPKFPRKIAVVTSPTGAAVRDIINIAIRRAPWIEILIIPCLVQGDEAPKSIVASLRKAYSLKGIDLIIVGRGGGSMDELWSFNDESVVRCIAESPVPIISAVGHETDFTLSDFSADRRAPTPSAAAEIATPDREYLKGYIGTVLGRIGNLAGRRIDGYGKVLRDLERRISLKDPRRRVEEMYQRVDEVDLRMRRAFSSLLNEKRNDLSAMCKRLNSLSPLNILARGYAVCQRADDGSLVASIMNVDLDDDIRIRVKDGIISAMVKGTAGNEEG